MDNKKLALSLIILLATLSMVFISPSLGAGEGEWIVSYKVQDTSSGQLLIDWSKAQNTSSNPVISGAEITVTATIHVITAGTGNLKLSTNMLKSDTKTIVWELVSTDYDMGSAFSPSSLSTQFNWVQGTFVIKCYGKTKNIAKPADLILVQLSSDTGTSLDNIVVTVQTQGADEFHNLLTTQQTKLASLKNSGVAAGYVTLFENVLAQAQSLNNKGETNDAIALLNSLPTSGEPSTSNTELITLPLIAVMAALAAVFAVMFIRVRGKVSYTRMVVEEQIKDLEGLTLRASKIDRTMSASLDSVKDRLKRLVGM